MKFGVVREGNPPIPPVIDCDDHDSASNVAPQFRPHQSTALKNHYIYQLDNDTRRIAHNHPSGLPTPSAADLAFTRALARVSQPLGLVLADHLILTDSTTVSFRDLGIL
ncbi:JAB domain-containing protein [Sphingomonas sp.]|uniref:JAB domain-containing protein n=1 Tax=Sphingomonas sp. TaxID=28214 RepID=UPI00258A26DA|nr:JAB domain-containing protein [Sphingomonas sp.]